MDFRNELRGIFEVSRPPRAQKDDIPRADLHPLPLDGGIQMVRRDFKIWRERRRPGDIEQDAPPQDGRNCIDRELPQASAVRLRQGRLLAFVQFSAAGEMAQRVDVRAYVAAHRDGVGG